MSCRFSKGCGMTYSEMEVTGMRFSHSGQSLTERCFVVFAETHADSILRSPGPDAAAASGTRIHAPPAEMLKMAQSIVAIVSDETIFAVFRVRERSWRRLSRMVLSSESAIPAVARPCQSRSIRSAVGFDRLQYSIRSASNIAPRARRQLCVVIGASECG